MSLASILQEFRKMTLEIQSQRQIKSWSLTRGFQPECLISFLEH